MNDVTSRTRDYIRWTFVGIGCDVVDTDHKCIREEAELMGRLHVNDRILTLNKY